MYRTHNCGELRASNAGQTVSLSAWVHRVRNLGGMTFVDLRDRYGLTQLVFNMDTDATLCEAARKLGREFVIQVEGTVAERSNKNAEMATGDIELIVKGLKIINRSETPPFTLEDESDGSEELRMRYRYIDLRRPLMTKRMEMRAKTIRAIREYLDGKDFLEVETPNLLKSTPEGARDFLVPSRLQHGKFYALPQSPQIMKQLLMVAGMDKYYQIVKCFRDEDFRGDRQPEFTQVDCEMSFVDQKAVLDNFEGMTKHVFDRILDVKLPEFKHYTYDYVLKNYGTDKPDLRFDCRIHELNEHIGGTEFQLFNKAIEDDKLAAGILAEGCANYTRKQLDNLTDFVRDERRGAGGLLYAKFNEDGTIKSSVDKFVDEAKWKSIGAEIGAKAGDLLLIIIDTTPKTRKVLSELRLEMAARENWIEENSWSVFWVVDFPLFGHDENTGEFTFMHHPFCSPHPEDMQYMETEPLRVRAQAYDMIINGNEIVSGSIRIHERDLQNKIFEILGMNEEEIEQKFGFMLDAFQYGAPPHGGCAFGLDRWVMLMSGGKTIRDVIAFPKNNAGKDLMMDAPSTVDQSQLEDLGIGIRVRDQA